MPIINSDGSLYCYCHLLAPQNRGEKVVAFVVYYDDGVEVFYFNLADGFDHAAFTVTFGTYPRAC